MTTPTTHYYVGQRFVEMRDPQGNLYLKEMVLRDKTSTHMWCKFRRRIATDYATVSWPMIVLRVKELHK